MENYQVIKKKKKKSKYSEDLRAIPFIAPGLVFMAIFYLTPVVLTVVFAFTDLGLKGPTAKDPSFIGLENFQTMVHDPVFWTSIIVTLLFLFLSAIIGQQFLGMTIALSMKGRAKWIRTLVGTIVIIAWVIPEMVVVYMMLAMFSPGGTLDAILAAGIFNIIPHISWLFEYPLMCVCLANVFRGTAFSMMIFQSALDDIPKEVEEAAEIDGANGITRFFKITLPMIKGSIMTNMILITLSTMGAFGLIFGMTGGGPGYQTTTLGIFMYQKAFSSYMLGYGTAIGLFLLLVGVIISLIYIRALKVKI